jgi:soluble lytic murein transglycosylase-like protein
MKATDSVTQQAGGAAYEQTGNYEMASKVKNLSGWRQYGYQQGRAQMAGASYGAYVEDAMNTDNTTQITVNGETFTPATARGGAQVQAAMATLRGQFVKQFGLSGTPVALLNKYAFPQMHRSDASLQGKFADRFAAEESQAETHEATLSFQADKDLGSFISRVSKQINPRTGKLYGNAGAHTFVKNYLKESIESGSIDEDEARSLEDQPVPWDSKGRTFGQYYPNLVGGAIKDAGAQRRSAARIEREEISRQASELEDEMVAKIYEGGYTNADIEALQKEFIKKYKKPSTKLNDAMKAASVNSQQKKAQAVHLQKLRQAGLLRPEHLADVHPDLYNQYEGIATNQEQLAGKTGSYTDSMNAIKQEVANAKGITLGEASLDVASQNIVTHLQDHFMKEVSRQIAAGNPNAVVDARNATLNYYKSNGGVALGDKVDPNLKDLPFYKDNYQKYLNKNSGAAAANAKIKSIADGLEKGGTAFLKKKDAILTQPELEKLEEDFGTAKWKMPELVKYLATQGGLDPFVIINAQREAWDMPPMPSLAGETVQGMTPKGKALLNQFRSQARSQRAYSREIGEFRPEMVKFGDFIQQSAATHGVEPAEIAALLEIESAGDPDAVSPTGAQGLMQIQTDVHTSYKGGKDPQQNIDYGTQYYAELLSQFGDPVHAAGAYNAGPGRFRAYLAGETDLPEETVQHMKKFTAALSRYNKQALNRPEGRRGSFELAQIVSNDPRYEGDNDPKTLYDPHGHGGDDMHQHYEFATKEMTLLAKALYEKQGFRVTSYMRPHDHGSAHQHGYAIDVAPPLDLPRNDEAEMGWIDKANAVIGLNS